MTKYEIVEEGELKNIVKIDEDGSFYPLMLGDVVRELNDGAEAIQFIREMAASVSDQVRKTF